MSERTLRSANVNAKDAVVRLPTVSRRAVAVDIDSHKDIAEAPMVVSGELAQRRFDLLEFYARYEEMISVLTEASQYGPSPRSEGEYQRLRGILQRGYTQIRRYVVAFLKYSPEDAQVGMGLWGRSADAFEALMAAASLQSFLKAEDGCLLSRISRTRDALNRYGEHLRRLSVQS